MSTMVASPQLFRASLVTMDPQTNTPKNKIEFQYNPDTLTRSLQAHSMGDGGSNSDVHDQLRLTGPPTETIQLEAEFDAADQMANAEPGSEPVGLHPVLAALEMLLYPRLDAMQQIETQLQNGKLEIIPPPMPLTIFVWGLQRALPVRLTDFSITEEAFDPDLNPIRAKVKLSLLVLTYQDLGFGSSGGSYFETYHRGKQVLAEQYYKSMMRGQN